MWPTIEKTWTPLVYAENKNKMWLSSYKVGYQIILIIRNAHVNQPDFVDPLLSVLIVTLWERKTNLPHELNQYPRPI